MLQQAFTGRRTADIAEAYEQYRTGVRVRHRIHLGFSRDQLLIIAITDDNYKPRLASIGIVFRGNSDESAVQDA